VVDRGSARVKKKVDPTPGALWSVKFPPICSTSLLEMNKPRPVPLVTEALPASLDINRARMRQFELQMTKLTKSNFGVWNNVCGTDADMREPEFALHIHIHTLTHTHCTDADIREPEFALLTFGNTSASVLSDSKGDVDGGDGDSVCSWQYPPPCPVRGQKL
jgi:hypothetical protein